MSVEKDIQYLENEIKALKTSFEQSATTLEFFSLKTSFTTSVRKYTLSNSSWFDPLQWEEFIRYLEEGGTATVGPYFADELVQVTFRATNGSNALADLEIENPENINLAHTIRVNYSGGARWIIDCNPNVSLVTIPGIEYRWTPTVLGITVRSIMPGTLEVRQL